MADRIAGLDEGAADIVVADDAELEGDAGLLREADRRRRAGIGHRHDDVGLDRAFDAPARRRCACARHRRCAPRPRNPAGRNRHIRRCRSAISAARTGTAALDALGGDDHHLAGLEVAHEARADDVERAGFGSEDPGAVEIAEHQRPDAERVAQPIIFFDDSATSEKAPSTWRIASMKRDVEVALAGWSR